MATLFNIPPVNLDCAAIENPLSVTAADQADSKPSIFTNVYPLWRPPLPSLNIWGGILLGQAISAAAKTVSSDFTLHNMSSYFLGATDATRPIFYRVQSNLDSRNYANRTVTAYQQQDESTSIFTLTASFQRKGTYENLITTAMPKTSPPPSDDHKPKHDADFNRNMASGNFLTHKGRQTTRTNTDPFIWHNLAPIPDKSIINLTTQTVNTTSYELSAWTLPRGGPISKDPSSQRAVLGCLTDCFLIYSIPEMLPDQLKSGRMRVSKLVSLNHHAWFHGEGGELEDWLFLRKKVTWGQHGRALFEQQFWSREGKLVLSSVQEAVVRVESVEGKAKI